VQHPLHCAWDGSERFCVAVVVVAAAAVAAVAAVAVEVEMAKVESKVLRLRRLRSLGGILCNPPIRRLRHNHKR
jgi:hypothetical protein